MPRCFAAGLNFRTIPARFNAPLEFLTGFTVGAIFLKWIGEKYFLLVSEETKEKGVGENVFEEGLQN